MLFAHPKIKEAAVAGLPDAKWGETVAAFVVLKDGVKATEEEIRSYCKQQLAAYKVPTTVVFRETLPKTLVGKVLRRILIEETKPRITV